MPKTEFETIGRAGIKCNLQKNKKCSHCVEVCPYVVKGVTVLRGEDHFLNLCLNPECPPRGKLTWQENLFDQFSTRRVCVNFSTDQKLEFEE